MVIRYPRSKHTGRIPTYNWEKFFANDEEFTVRKGVDFRCNTDVFKQQIRQRASERGLKVSLHTIDEFSFTVLVRRF